MSYKRLGGALAAVVALGLSACILNLNESGRVSATKTGDVSHLAERGSPTEPLEAACGAAGELTAAAERVIVRQPYLQQLTTTSVMIGWRTPSPVDQRVEVTTPDGAPVATVAAEREDTMSRGDQMWASVDGLEPDTIYCYAVEGAAAPLTERIGFRTAPAADSERPIRILAFGDSGDGGDDQRALAAQMQTLPSELIIHVGDLAYDNGTLQQFEDTVFRPYAELLRHLAFFPASGNHDYETMQGQPYRDVFALPGDSGERWYSYDYGRIHFAVLDTELSYPEQVAWLDADLAQSAAPWKIVYLHKPPYSSGEHGSDVGLRTLLAPILEKHGVQLVLAGHDHHYERMHPQHGVAYVVTGGGGRGVREASSSAFTAFVENVIHFVYIEVDKDELVVHAIDGTGKEFDAMVVPRISQPD